MYKLLKKKQWVSNGVVYSHKRDCPKDQEGFWMETINTQNRNVLDSILCDYFDIDMCTLRKIKEYHRNKRNISRGRGIEYKLQFGECLEFWCEKNPETSQPYHYNMGHTKNDYVMSRFGDEGPYIVGNIYHSTQSDNMKYYHDLIKQLKIKTKKEIRDYNKYVESRK